MDYASQEGVQNRMTQILSGADIKDFFFIGLMERFEEDIRELSMKMGWPDNIELPDIVFLIPSAVLISFRKSSLFSL